MDLVVEIETWGAAYAIPKIKNTASNEIRKILIKLVTNRFHNRFWIFPIMITSQAAVTEY